MPCALAALLTSTVLLAPGFSGPFGVGGLSPLAETPVALERATISLVVNADGTRFDVQGRYRLVNPGQAGRVRLGVPVVWLQPTAAGPSAEEEAAFLRRGAREIHLEVAGREVACALQKGSSSSGGRSIGPTRNGLEQSGWCTATVEVPAGEVTAEIRFQGEVRLVDEVMDEAAGRGWYRPDHPDGRVDFEPVPSTLTWRGETRRLDVRLDLGRWGEWLDLDSLSPARPRREGTSLLWRHRFVDSRQEGYGLRVEATLKELGTTRPPTPPPSEGFRRETIQVRATSTLAPQGTFRFEAPLVLDGDPGTAWCEGVDGSGLGQWIELSVEDVGAAPGCRLTGYAITPGYARDDVTYRRNNRITWLRIAACGASELGQHAYIEPPDLVSEALVPLPPVPNPFGEAQARLRAWLAAHPGGQAPPKFPACVRFELEEVLRGADDDTCISELRPVFDCSTKGAR